MNVGLGNLRELKAHLLAEALRADSAYDEAIAAIGKGVAALFEKFCDRKFGRVENDTETFAADRAGFVLSRFPIESVSKLEFKSDEATGFVEWTPLTDYIRSIDNASGVIYLPDQADAGKYWSQLRFTFTGGYWFDTSEDAESPEAQPAGSNALPNDLKLAWLQQCQELWNKRDKLGTGIVAEAGKEFSLAGTGLLAGVKIVLMGYQRFAIT